MAPLRQKLIHVLASIVAIDLAVAGVVIDSRSGAASASSTVALKPTAANGSVLPSGSVGGILGAATFKHRRGQGGSTVTTAASGSSQLAAGFPAASPSSSATTGAPVSSGSTATTGRPRSTGGSGSTGGASNGQTGRTAPPSTSGGPTGAPAGATNDPGTTGGDGGTVFDPGPGSTTGDTSPPSGTTGTTATTAPARPPVKGPPSIVVTDKTGDTQADGAGTVMAQPQADIVKAQADWSAKALVFAVQVAQPVNPAQDPHWASDGTYIQWDLDTNGDGAPDFSVQYYFDPKSGLVADVTKASDTTGPSLCPAEAGYTADGYTVAIDPACLGNPAAVTFRATTYYDPDPANPNGNVATDTTPDANMSGPVSKP